MGRKKESQFIKGAEGRENEYNDQAGAQKVLGPLTGVLSFLGDAQAGINVPTMGATVAIYNDDSVTHWIAYGAAAAPSAPTGGANGIAVPPHAYIYLSMGANRFLKADNVTGKTWAYLVADDTVYSPTASN